MTPKPITTLLFGAAGLVLFSSAAGAASLMTKSVAAPTPLIQQIQFAQGCVVDDGYGRKSSCDSFYKQMMTDNKTAPAGCTVDDGYGRKSSCDAFFKDRSNTGEQQKK